MSNSARNFGLDVAWTQNTNFSIETMVKLNLCSVESDAVDFARQLVAATSFEIIHTGLAAMKQR